MKIIEGPIDRVEFDVHRWYTIVRIIRPDGSVEGPVIGLDFPGEGPSLFDSYAEWEEASEG
ncbi:MAG: hypothetical protein WC054_00985 [Candidatus Nanopelagicales bacterium]